MYDGHERELTTYRTRCQELELMRLQNLSDTENLLCYLYEMPDSIVVSRIRPSSGESALSLAIEVSNLIVSV